MNGPEWEVATGGAFAFAEAILGVGIVLPGEVVVTGVASTTSADQRAYLFAAVTLGATLGDHLNYWLGRVLGVRLSASRLVARIGTKHWDRAVELVHRHGEWAIVVSRLLPVVRTLMAAVAGVAQMSYYRFSLASLIGCALWASVWVGAGTTLRSVLANPVLAVPVLVFVVAAVLARRWWRRRRQDSDTRVVW